MDLREVIVGIDFSPESCVAFEDAVAIALTQGSAIRLVHATRAEPESEHEDGGGGMPYAAELVDLHRRVMTHVEEDLDDLAESARAQHLPASWAIVHGNAADALCEEARRREARLVAVGSTGASGARRFLLGTVAQKVARRCTELVLVARPGRRRGYQRILVAIDFSSASADALAAAIALAAPGAHIEVLHCWPPPAPLVQAAFPDAAPALIVREHIEACERIHRERAVELVDAHRHADVTFDIVVSMTPAIHGIRERAAGVDLIAMGSRGNRGLRRLVLGSVVEATLRYAACSVLVAHRNDHRD